jgi:enoyl-CoA hydratase
VADSVLTEAVDGVQIITINRPEVRNAVNGAVAAGIAAAIEELEARDDLIAGVLTGAGKSFCTGMDLKAFLAGERPSVAGRGFAGIVESPPGKPVIAAVEGHAVAGGFEIALACDMIVAAEDAVFGLPEVKRGLVAAGGGLLRLPRRAPYNLVVEWVLTGRPIPAAKAHEVSLVNRLTPPGEALAGALELAHEIAANGPLAVRATRRIIAESGEWPEAEAFDRQRAISEPVRASQDARAGALAFVEKRAPRWRGI